MDYINYLQLLVTDFPIVCGMTVLIYAAFHFLYGRRRKNITLGRIAAEFVLLGWVFMYLYVTQFMSFGNGLGARINLVPFQTFRIAIRYGVTNAGMLKQIVLSYPVEIAPNGQSIRVSKNYFHYNPIETVDGSDLIDQIIYDDLTLNILVPEKYQNMERQIIEAYRDNFYFEKVQAENDYNEMADNAQVLNIPLESLNVHIIYVKSGQQYFTYRDDCAPQTKCWITDPVVQIYTSNIHCNYAHSFISQWTYFFSDSGSEQCAFESILPYIRECGAEDSVQAVRTICVTP